MAKGMRNADQALLAGCSAGGLASVLHCDEFRDLFPDSTKVKCLSDAGLFLDAYVATVTVHTHGKLNLLLILLLIVDF